MDNPNKMVSQNLLDVPVISLDPDEFELDDEEYNPEDEKCLCLNVIEEEDEYICECLEEECICEELPVEEHDVEELKGEIVKIEADVVKIEADVVNIEEENKETFKFEMLGEEDSIDEAAVVEEQEKIHEEIEEEIIEAVEEEEKMQIKINRESYVKELMYFKRENASLEIRNNVLNNLLTSYYTRKGMQHVLHKENAKIMRSALKKKYEEKLQVFNELKTRIINTEQEESQGFKELEAVLEKKEATFSNEFQMLQAREKEVASGLKSRRTGLEMAEKVIDRFLARQSSELSKLTKFRYKYIKVKNDLNAKIEATQNLMKIGPGLTIDYYETLLIIRALAMDRIQEKEADLERWRDNCNKTTVILSHTREKHDVLGTDMNYFTSHLKKMVDEVLVRRESVNALRCNRDKIRKISEKLKNENILCFNKDLLCDMYDTEIKINERKILLEELKISYNEDRQKILNLRNVSKTPSTFSLENSNRNKSPGNKKKNSHLRKAK